MGKTDYVALFEAPNEKEALAVIVALGKAGYFTTLSILKVINTPVTSPGIMENEYLRA